MSFEALAAPPGPRNGAKVRRVNDVLVIADEEEEDDDDDVDSYALEDVPLSATFQVRFSIT